MRKAKAGGGWQAIGYTLRKSRGAGGLLAMYRALRSNNACKTCALGMGGQLGGMVNEKGVFPEVCKKSIQAMAADLAGRVHEHFFDDFSLDALRGFSSRELEAAGRLVEPLFAGPLDSHYRRIGWDEAIDRIAAKLRKISPSESFFYFSGRSSNEAGYLLQLFARLYGTNNVSSCSFYCHQASGVALASVTGSGTATITLEDLDKADLIFIIGANPASNHPRFMRTLVDLKRRGGKVIVINPLREVGLVRFRVPSDWRSLLFGTSIADMYLQPHIGGDIALLSGIAKFIIERGAFDQRFTRNFAEGWDAFRQHITAMSWSDLLEESGVDRALIKRAADLFIQSQRTVFCWAMGMTHHAHGVENVQAIANLAMTRGMLGKAGAGLLPLRGHSNVQGIGSVGAVPRLRPAVAQRIQEHFGVTLPEEPGLDTFHTMQRMSEGTLRLGWCLGGNLFGSNPDADFARRAMGSLDMIVHLNTTLNTGHAHALARETIILPVLARDEEQQPTTQESMFNYVRLSDGGPLRYDGPRAETDIIADVAQRVIGSRSPVNWAEMRRHQRIRQAIAATIPGYDKVGRIDESKEEFHIGGRTFREPKFATDSGRAAFHVVHLPRLNGHHGQSSDALRGRVRMLTLRSEGQFNTVVYEDEDTYRGQDRRDVIMMHADDVVAMGLTIDQRVKVTSEAGTLRNVLVRAIDIRRGNAAMYFPEANVLVPRVADSRSGTPAFKSFFVTVAPDDGPETAPAEAERPESARAVAAPRRNLQAC
jgi:molybdopterin-dependent oxidoreductase alpha subunit